MAVSTPLNQYTPVKCKCVTLISEVKVLTCMTYLYHESGGCTWPSDTGSDCSLRPCELGKTSSCSSVPLRSKASSTFPWSSGWSSGQGECVPCSQIGCSVHISCNISLSLSMSVLKKSHPRRASLSINPSCCFHNMEARRAAGACVSVCVQDVLLSGSLLE